MADQKELVGVIQKMKADGRSDDEIKFVVNEYVKRNKPQAVEQPKEESPLISPVGSVEKETNPLISGAKATWSALSHGGRSGAAATYAAARSGDAKIAEKLGGFVPVFGFEGGISTGIPGVRLESKEEVLVDKSKLYNYASKIQGEGQEYTKDLVNSLDKIEDPLDAINWVASAVGQAVGQIPAAALTGGTSALLLETGEIYMAGVQKLAEEHGITPQEVVERGLDDPAFAFAFGTAAAALETVGANQVLDLGSAMFKKSLQKKLRFQALKSGLVEAPTEAAQTILENIGSSQTAGKTFSESIKDIDYKDVVESAAQGFVGGGGITTAIGGYAKLTQKKETPAKKEVDVDKTIQELTGVKGAVKIDKDTNAIIDDVTKLGIPNSQSKEMADEVIDETANEVKKEVVKGTYSAEDLAKELGEVASTTRDTNTVTRDTTNNTSSVGKSSVTSNTNSTTSNIYNTTSNIKEEKERNKTKKEKEEYFARVGILPEYSSQEPSLSALENISGSQNSASIFQNPSLVNTVEQVLGLSQDNSLKEIKEAAQKALSFEIETRTIEKLVKNEQEEYQYAKENNQPYEYEELYNEDPKKAALARVTNEVLDHEETISMVNEDQEGQFSSQINIASVEQRLDTALRNKAFLENEIGVTHQQPATALREPLSVVKAVQSKEGLPFNENSREKVRRAYTRPSITTEEKDVLDKWVADYKKDVEERAAKRKRPAKEKSDVVAQPKKEKTKELKPLSNYSKEAIRLFAKNKEHRLYNDAVAYLDKIKKEKEASNEAKRKDRTNDLGPAKAEYQKKEKVSQKALKEAEKEAAPEKAFDSVNSLIDKLLVKGKDKTLEERSVLKISLAIRDIRNAIAKKETKKQDLEEATKLVRELEIPKSVSNLFALPLTVEINNVTREFKEAVENQKKELLAELKGKSKEEQNKVLAEWRGTLAEKIHFNQKKDSLLSKIEMLFVSIEGVQKEKENKDRAAKEKDLLNAINEYAELLRDRGRQPLSEAQRGYLLATGNIEGNKKRAEDVIKEYNDKKVNLLFKDTGKDSFKSSPGAKTLGEITGDEDIQGKALFSGRQSTPSKTIVASQKITNPVRISISDFISKYVRPYVKNDFTFNKFLNLIELANKIYKEEIAVYEADDIGEVVKEGRGERKVEHDTVGGFYAMSKSGKHYLVISKNSGNPHTGLHEFIHYFTAPLINEEDRIYEKWLQTSGYSKGQISVFKNIAKEISRDLEKANSVSAVFKNILNSLGGIDDIQESINDLKKKHQSVDESDIFVYEINRRVAELKYTSPNMYSSIAEFFRKNTTSKDMFLKASYLAGQDGVYGFTNHAEYIAEAASNTAFNLLLASIKSRNPVTYKVGSLLSNLIDYISALATNIFGIDPIVFNSAYKNSLLNKYNGLISMYENTLSSPKNEGKLFSDVKHNIESLGEYLDVFASTDKNNEKKIDNLAEEITENTNKLNALNYGPSGKKIALNKERVKIVLRYISAKTPSYQELVDAIASINDTLAEGKKVSLNEINSAWRSHKSSERAKQVRAVNKEIEKAKLVATIDLDTAKEMVINEYSKKIPAFSGYKRADILRILDNIKAVKNPKDLYKYLDELKEVVADFKFNKAYVAAQSAKEKIQKFTKSGFSIIDKPLWKSMIKVNLDLLNRDELEEYARLMSVLKLGNKKFKGDKEFQEWKNVKEHMASFIERYNKIYLEDIADTLEEEAQELSAEEKKERKDKKIAGEEKSRRELFKLIQEALKEARKAWKEKYAANATDLNKEYASKLLGDRFLGKSKDFSIKDLQKLADGLIDFARTGLITDKAGALISKMDAEDRIVRNAEEIKKAKKDLIAATTTGKILTNLMSSSQIASFIAKQVKPVSSKIWNLFYETVRKKDSFIHTKHAAIVGGMNKLADELKLNEDSLIRIALFSRIFTTNADPNTESKAYLKEINDNRDKVFKSVLNKIAAAEIGKEDKALAKRELELYKQIDSDLRLKGKNAVLTKEETTLRNAIIEQYENLKSDFMQSTVAFAGKVFVPLNEYVGTLAIGTVSEGKLGDDKANVLVDIMEKGSPEKLSETESGFSKSRYHDVKGAYYNNNVLDVFNKSVLESLYDSNMLEEVYALNHILKDKRVVEAIGGHENLSVIKNSLIKAIKRGRGKYGARSKALRALESVKNAFVIGRMGTTFQLATQLMAMIPSIGINNPKGFHKASKLIFENIIFGKDLNIPGHPDVKTIKQWVNKFGQGLQQRDVMFEKFESMADFNAMAQWYNKTSKKAEDLTLYTLKNADRISSTWTFFSSYLENGGTLEDPLSDKSQKAMAQAEQDTDIFQNVSNPRFASNVFTPDSDQARIVASFLYTFKSFAVNQSMNFIYSIRNARTSEEARRLLAATTVNAVIYNLVAIYMSMGIGGVVSALFGDDEDKEKSAMRNSMMSENLTEKIISRAGADMVLGWMPSLLEQWTKGSYDAVRAFAIKEIMKDETFTPRKDKVFFDNTGNASAMFGGYSGITESVSSAASDYKKLATDDLEASTFIISELGNAITFFKLVPFRGDISRILRTFASVQKTGFTEDQVNEMNGIIERSQGVGRSSYDRKVIER